VSVSSALVLQKLLNELSPGGILLSTVALFISIIKLYFQEDNQNGQGSVQCHTSIKFRRRTFCSSTCPILVFTSN
jgi:hypothetical protein